MKRCGLLVLLIFIGCNKLPLGEDELENRGDFESITLDLSLYTAFTESKLIPLGSSQNLVLGKDNRYQSRIILSFNFSDTTYQGLDQIKLILFKNNSFNNDTLRFSVHVLTSDFSETEATWYKKDNTDLWTSAGGDFEIDSLRQGEIKGDSCVVYFNYIDLNKIRNGKGVILLPQDTGFCSFYARESGKPPLFRLVKNNVVTSIPIKADCHIMQIDTFPNYWENWLGSGVAFRDYVKFAYDTLLDNTRAVYGELTFKAKNYFGLRDSIEIGVKCLTKPYSGFDTELGPLIALKKFALNDTAFTIDVVQYVQRIIEHPDSNFGMFIYLSPENYDIANIQLVTGSHQLKVGYIKPPEER
ncbi:MAG: DNRLRE domain-containing protein [candidate division WOR-3 bacterium]